MLKEYLVNQPATTARAMSADTAVKEAGSLAKQFLRKGFSIGFGISLAGASYPCVVVLIIILLMVCGLPQFPRSNPGPSEVELALHLLFYACTLGAIIGLFCAAVVSIVVLPLLYVVVWSVEFRGRLDRLSAFAGGLVGFLAVMQPLLNALRFSQSNLVPPSTLAIVLPLIVFPGVAIVLGQVGGAWGARRVVQSALVRKDRVLESAAACDTSGATAQSLRFQFGLRHLIWVGTWVSLLLGVIRLSGVRFDLMLLFLVGWVVYQSTTLWAGGRMARWLADWAGRRKSCST